MALKKLLLTLATAVSVNVYAQTSYSVLVKAPKQLPASEQRISVTKKQITISEIHRDLFVRDLVISQDVWNLPDRFNIDVHDLTVPQYCEVLTTKVTKITWRFNGKNYSLVLRPRGKVQGRVLDSLQYPLGGANIKIKGTTQSVEADESGNFELTGVLFPAVILVSYTGKQTVEIKADSAFNSSIVLSNSSDMPNVTVTAAYDNGYEKVSRETATGSSSKVNMDLVNSIPNTNIIDRLNNLNFFTPRNNYLLEWSQPFSYRGLNTLYGTTKVPVVHDFFPLTVDPAFINPSNIGAIFQIYDAAAAAIHGTHSANGVLVIKSINPVELPKGITVTSRFTISKAPDLSYQSGIEPADYVDIEEYLFRQRLIHPSGISDLYVRDILTQELTGGISPDESKARLKYYRQQNILRDIGKYFYQQAINQQYAINLNTRYRNFFVHASLGFDQNRSYEKGNNFNRLTGMVNVVRKKKNLTIRVNTYFSTINTTNNFINVPKTVPYLPLIDANGNYLPVGSNPSDTFLKNNTPGGFYNWENRPMQEAKVADITGQKTFLSITTQLSYTLFKNFTADFTYQYARMNQDGRKYSSPETFAMRDIVNKYRQVDAGGIYYPVPLRGMHNLDSAWANINNLRLQLNYSLIKQNNSELNIMAGIESRYQRMKLIELLVYGPTPDYPQDDIDYITRFPSAVNSTDSIQIPYSNSKYDSTDYTESFFGSVRYSFGKKKYILSSSVRRDYSNRFARHANMNGMPLYSIGAAWYINKENFYHYSLIEELKLRMSYGINGNTDLTAMPQTTIALEPTNSGSPVYTVVNSANRKLAWEKIHMYNAGIDLTSAGDWITASFDYYRKRGKDILQLVQVNPTGGNDLVKRNAGTIKGSGFDLALQTKNIPLGKDFSIAANFLFRRTKSEITSDQPRNQPAWKYTDPLGQLFMKGYSPDAIFALRYGPLDGNTGDPQGYKNGVLSKNYKQIMEDTSLSGIVYMGTLNPKTFTSLVLVVNWNSFSAAIYLNGRFDYFMRTAPLDYAALQDQNSIITKAFYRRWQKPGDENHSSVPSLSMNTPFRDRFYALSTEHVAPADNLRLQRLQISYLAGKNLLSFLRMKQLQFSITVSNVALLWRANDMKIDPEVPLGLYPEPTSITFGANVRL